MSSSKFDQLFILLCFSVLVSSKSENPHFRGGWLQWKLTGFDTTKQQYNVTFEYEFSWDLGYGPCGPYCSNSDLNLIGKHPGPEVFVCEGGCTGKPTLSNAAYRVTDISLSNNWEMGIGTFYAVFNSTGPFKVSIEGKEWVPLSQETSGDWRLKTELNFGKRSDTGFPNNSPQIFHEKVYYVYHGCEYNFKINTMDPDGDRIRCRFGETPDECGGVCKALPGVVLDPDSCTISPKAILSYGAGLYAASIVVEDLPYSDVTVDGNVYNQKSPFSQIPTQFLVYVTSNTLQCNSLPSFINPPWGEGQVIVVMPGFTYTETICAKPTGKEPVDGLSAFGPKGLTNSVIQGQLPGSRCIFLTWIPTAQQLGSHFLCVTAKQADGMSSKPTCVTLHVDDVDNCKSNPCSTGLTCQDSINSFRCINRTVSSNNNTEITSSLCLQSQLDLVFALDSSNSLTTADKLEMKRFMSELVLGFGVGHNQARIGIVTYDDSPHLVFDLDTYSNTQEVVAAIANVTFGYGGSNTGGVLKYIQEEMFSVVHGDREQVPNVLVVLTDGHSNYPYSTKYYANAARNVGITIFAVGVGPAVKLTELENIASTPHSKYLFSVDSFADLKSISDHLVNTTCTVRLPNETVPLKTTARPGCYNRKEDCELYGEGVCTDYPGWSSDNCALWCGFCNGTTTLPPCLNTLHNCYEFSYDVCTKPELRIWAMKNCREKCGFPPCVSTLSPITTTPKPTTPGPCGDRLNDCSKYDISTCSDPAYMGWAKGNCAAYCGFCTEYTDVPPETIGSIQCPGWKLPVECTMQYYASCCPLPKCPAGFKLTVEKPHL